MFFIGEGFHLPPYRRDKSCEIQTNIAYPPLQPDATDDFPTAEGKEPRIPHIIHQTWTTEEIPSIYWDYIKTVVNQNPTWKYYFWSVESVMKLIKDKYPSFESVWNKLSEPIHKADALRYLVLYEYGGVYLDMDMEVLRPLNRITMKYASVLAVEPFEHSVFLFHKQFLLNNCFMCSRKHHPFFKMLVDKLEEMGLKERTILAKAGPVYLQKIFNMYNNVSDSEQHSNKTKVDCSSNSPYFYKGELPEDDENATYVANTQYLSDVLDLEAGYEKKFTNICNKWNQLSYLSKRVCSDMFRRGANRREAKFRFVTHHWSHSYVGGKKKDIHNMTKQIISTLVPDCYIYGKNLS